MKTRVDVSLSIFSTSACHDMNTLYFYVNFLRELTRLMKHNYKFVFFYIFAHYVFHKLKVLMNVTLKWKVLSDCEFKNILKQSYDKAECYIDCNSCLTANVKLFNVHTPTWFYVCSTVSFKKYKLLVVPLNDLDTNEVFVSEIVRHNIENVLECTSDNWFLLPTTDDTVNFAAVATISTISKSHEYTNDLIVTILEDYFSEPRFLRKNDLFAVNANDRIHSYSNPLLSVIYFKVNTIRVKENVNCRAEDGCYILREETTLIQESDVHSYLPRRHICLDAKEKLVEPYPPNFTNLLIHLEHCISPFIKYDIRLAVKPIFLIKGSPGSNKCKLVETLSERIGLNFLHTDLAEVQALTSAQTEAKLRIVLHNAEQSVPCILCLSNIEVFGKNSEGQKDERIISTFSMEVNTLYNKHLKYPVIIIATANESEIPPELNRMFIETIRMECLNKNERTDLISWLLKKQNINCQTDLSRVAGMCSDYRFADFSALVLHAVKFHKKHSSDDLNSLTLTREDFDQAYEYMQLIYTDSKGVPRVPRVHWEDIGGLAELKHEIMRRIQLPLLNALGFGQSGLLLYGPPGTGKTLLAKAVATEYQLHFLSVKGPEVLNMYVGQSEKNIRQVFERARSAAPCIIFFDELDSLAPNRGRSGDSGGVMDRVVSQLLAEMDGLDGTNSIFIIGATNRPDLIDPALLRPGRFDKLLYVGIHSDRDAQLKVLEALTRKFQLRKNGEELVQLLDQLPAHTTGADLYSVCSNAWLNAARNVLSKLERNDFTDDSVESITVELEDFLKAAREMVPSVSKEEAKRYRRMRTELSSS